MVHTVELGNRSLTVGRAPDNGLILRDPDVSGHHAVLFWEHDELCARDLGSTNGLFRNGERVGVSRISVGDVLDVGGLQLVLRGDEPQPIPGLALRRVGAPVANPVESGFSLPHHPDVVVFEDTDGIWLDDGSTRDRVTLGTPFTLGGEDWVLEASPEIAPTVPRDGLFPYSLEVALGDNRAVLRTRSLPEVEFRAPARVSLLYVLAEHPGEWVDNDTIGRGVWGREWERQGANNLNVLVHRTRRQAEDEGYDRRFLERDRSAMRLALADARTV